jgi:hypothetical protein
MEVRAALALTLSWSWSAHMPFDVVSAYAQEHVGAHAIGMTMMTGSHFYVDGLQPAEVALMRRSLARAKRGANYTSLFQSSRDLGALWFALDPSAFFSWRRGSIGSWPASVRRPTSSL